MRIRDTATVALISMVLLATTAASVAAQDDVADPLAFTRSMFPTEPDARQAGIAALPTGEILVVGDRKERRSHGWLSTDGGDTWDRNGLGMPRKQEHMATDVIEWDGGFVVIGSLVDDRIDRGYVVMSLDGVTWTDPIFVKRARFTRIQATGEGLLIIGEEMQGRNSGKNSHQTYHPAVFSSADGMTWTTHRVETAYVGGPDEDSGLLTTSGVARSDSGIWLVPGIHHWGGIPGFIDPNDLMGLLWRSEDGVSWTPMDLPTGRQSAAGAPAFPGPVAWTPSGFVLATSDGSESPGSMWHSEDGLSWERVASTGTNLATAFAVDGQRVVAFTQPGLVPDGSSSPGPDLWADGPNPVFQTMDGRSWTESPVATFESHVVERATIDSGGRKAALGRAADTGTPWRPIPDETVIWIDNPS